ncbi:GNAT family N-acetyltransferase [Sphaerobacter thermophilus]|uniref:GNAT family N-acetyltransferase n=1 Tax=Sphaerobacter thermophilus TaxID=2057 RepID=UPI0039C1DFCC
MVARTPPEPASLQGDRITLTPLGEADLDDVRRWRSDPDVTRYWITQVVPTRAEMRAWLARNRREGALLWVIRDERRHRIGFVTLFGIDPEHRKAELALMIGERDIWGQGYARETLRVVLRHAFTPTSYGGLGLHKVWLCVVAENQAARRAYVACGFREDGVLREDLYRDGVWHDQILMSILEDEFWQHNEARPGGTRD